MPNGYTVLERKVEKERGGLCYFLRKKGCEKAAPGHQILYGILSRSKADY